MQALQALMQKRLEEGRDLTPKTYHLGVIRGPKPLRVGVEVVRFDSTQINGQHSVLPVAAPVRRKETHENEQQSYSPGSKNVDADTMRDEIRSVPSTNVHPQQVQEPSVSQEVPSSKISEVTSETERQFQSRRRQRKWQYKQRNGKGQDHRKK